MVDKTRLNLGCGSAPNPEYLNVDVRKFEGVDVVADVRDLKFQPGTFTEILAKDVIEHLSFEEAKKLLRNCYNWLKTKGVIVLHTQNMCFLVAELASTKDYTDDFHHEVLKWIYGSNGEGGTNHPYGFHRWGYSKESLSKILETMGFQVVDATVDCGGFGLRVIAYKTQKEV